MSTDKTLQCKDCGTDFVFTAREQEFYAQKGFQNEPTRCKACRDNRKQSRDGGGGGGGYGGGRDRGERQMFSAVCSTCGSQTQVPFKPDPAKPVTAVTVLKNHVTAKHDVLENLKTPVRKNRGFFSPEVRNKDMLCPF